MNVFIKTVSRTDLVFPRTESHDARKYRPTFSLVYRRCVTRTAGHRPTTRTSSSTISIIAISSSTCASCVRSRRTRFG